LGALVSIRASISSSMIFGVKLMWLSSSTNIVSVYPSNLTEHQPPLLNSSWHLLWCWAFSSGETYIIFVSHQFVLIIEKFFGHLYFLREHFWSFVVNNFFWDNNSEGSSSFSLFEKRFQISKCQIKYFLSVWKKK
jgi:hypothetical protein